MHKNLFTLLSLIFMIFNSYSMEKKEKKIVTVTPSYDNKNGYKKNLDYIFTKEYSSSIRLDYIDDLSPDIKEEVEYNPIFDREAFIRECMTAKYLKTLENNENDKRNKRKKK